MIIKKDPSIIQSYLEDSSNLQGGQASEVFVPESIEEISYLLKEANSKKIPVTISGAGTGQAGGRIPFGGLVLSMEKLNKIKEIYPVRDTRDATQKGRISNRVKKRGIGGYAVVEAGVIIRDLKVACEREGLFYTYNPTEETAFAGGTIATNASGARSFKYGSTRRHVRALKLILADGTIFFIRRQDFNAKGRTVDFEVDGKGYHINLPTYKMPQTKNSSGYYAEDDMDLVELFVGQEGTLAAIVEAELGLPKKPDSFFSSFIFFTEDRDALSFAEEARNSGALAIEYIDNNCLSILQEKYHNVPGLARAAIFLEEEIIGNEDEVLKKWEASLSKYGVSLDNTWVAINEKTRQGFLDKRHFLGERMDELTKQSGFSKVHTDLAVPKKNLLAMIQFYKDCLKDCAMPYFVFGHIGDAHLHVNIFPKDNKSYDKAKKIELEFVKKSISLGGTVSAEHGIGKTKREFLKLLYGEKGITEMLKVKKTLDPNLILGRGNIFEC